VDKIPTERYYREDSFNFPQWEIDVEICLDKLANTPPYFAMYAEKLAELKELIDIGSAAYEHAVLRDAEKPLHLALLNRIDRIYIETERERNEM